MEVGVTAMTAIHNCADVVLQYIKRENVWFGTENKGVDDFVVRVLRCWSMHSNVRMLT